MKDIEKNDNSVDVIATPPKSRRKVLIRIVTEPRLDSGKIGKQYVEEMKERLDDSKFEKVILIGKSFTVGAKSDLGGDGIEFISKDESIVNLMDPAKLYKRIHVLVDNLCKIQCGRIPKSEKQCKGYNPNPSECPTCKGTGNIKRKGRKTICPDCGGKTIEPTYTCDVRVISDNADFHFEKGWVNLLQNDIEQLLKIQLEYTPTPKLSEKILKVQKK